MIIKKREYYYIGVIILLLTTIILILGHKNSLHYQYTKAAEEFYTLYHSIGADVDNINKQSECYLFMTQIDDNKISRMNTLVKEVEENVSKENYIYYTKMKVRISRINDFIQNRGISWSELTIESKRNFGNYIDIIIMDYLSSQDDYPNKLW